MSFFIDISQAVFQKDDIEPGFLEVFASVSYTKFRGDSANEDILRLEH